MTARSGAKSREMGPASTSRKSIPTCFQLPNRTRHPWAPWDAYIYTLDPDTLFDEFRQRGVSFARELSFIDEGLWGFEITDADGYLLAFFQLRDK